MDDTATALSSKTTDLPSGETWRDYLKTWFSLEEWRNSLKGEDGYPWFSRGDADAFAALCADNIATILVLTSFLGTVLPQNIIWKKVLPGCGISLLFGNVYYSMLATRMSRKEGRTDVCAQPYGINTPGAFAFCFTIIIPAYNMFLENGKSKDEAAELAYITGVAANFVSGIIEYLGSFVGRALVAKLPRLALSRRSQESQYRGSPSKI